jgi:hypothetical protein
MKAHVRRMQSAVVIGIGADLLAIPMGHWRLRNCRLPARDLQPQSFTAANQHRHRQQPDAQFINGAGFDRIGPMVLEECRHFRRQIGVFGAVRSPKPALAHLDERRLVASHWKQRQLHHDVHVALVGRCVQ